MSTEALIVVSNFCVALPTLIMALVAMHDMNETVRKVVGVHRQLLLLLAQLLGINLPDPQEHKHRMGHE